MEQIQVGVVEKILSELDPYLKKWATKFSRWRMEAYEDILQEMRVVLLEKGVQNPELFTKDKTVGYYYVLLRNHFSDLDRRKRIEAKYQISLDLNQIEFDLSVQMNPSGLEEESALIRAALLADPKLVRELIYGDHMHQRGGINHVKVAERLGIAHTTYYRRLNRLVKRIQLSRQGGKIGYQMGLF